jgi:hypothetical protein
LGLAKPFSRELDISRPDGPLFREPQRGRGAKS